MQKNHNKGEKEKQVPLESDTMEQGGREKVAWQEAAAVLQEIVPTRLYTTRRQRKLEVHAIENGEDLFCLCRTPNDESRYPSAPPIISSFPCPRALCLFAVVLVVTK